MVPLISIGLLLIAVAALFVVGDWAGLSERMPTQVPPRRYAWFPFLGGIALIVAGLTIRASRGI